MDIKCIAAGISVAVSFVAVGSTPLVTEVTMSQPADSRRVTITYKMDGAPAVVTLDVQTNRTGRATESDADWVSIGGVAVCNAQGAVWRKVTEADKADGLYTITWRPDLSWPDHKIDNKSARAVVTAWALDNTPDYMVVDIAAAAKPDSQRYYPAVDFLPGSIAGQVGSITNNVDYRTTSIVMRKIMAKDVEWTMGSTVLEELRKSTYSEDTHKVMLTNNYYMGVFEVTQSQWALVQTDNPTPSWHSNLAYRAMRPVEYVSYDEIRCAAKYNGGDKAFYWPAPPHPDSFLGRLRTKTGLDFDLPSEAQWEFAARAGNGDTKWGDGSVILNVQNDANMNLLGRNKYNGGLINGTDKPDFNCGGEHGTAIVGSYRPNSWGLFDTSGNVYEICLDWLESDIKDYGGMININPADPTKTLSGAESERRVLRGGNYESDSSRTRPAFRGDIKPTIRGFYAGFRLYCQGGLL